MHLCIVLMFGWMMFCYLNAGAGKAANGGEGTIQVGLWIAEGGFGLKCFWQFYRWLFFAYLRARGTLFVVILVWLHSIMLLLVT